MNVEAIYASKIDPEEWETCKTCNGQGDIECECEYEWCEARIECPHCEGTGLRDSDVLH